MTGWRRTESGRPVASIETVRNAVSSPQPLSNRPQPEVELKGGARKDDKPSRNPSLLSTITLFDGSAITEIDVLPTSRSRGLKTSRAKLLRASPLSVPDQLRGGAQAR
jgi:hypothetical protein